MVPQSIKQKYDVNANEFPENAFPIFIYYPELHGTDVDE
jgi:hypothetical protein